jgi:hypothetical protein
VAAVSPQIDFKATVGDAVGQALINEALSQMLVAQYLQRPDLPQRQSSAIAESGAKRSLLGSYNAIHRNVSAVEDGLGNPDSDDKREAGLEKQARTVLMGREVSKIFQANSGAVRGEIAAVNHAERSFLLAFENHATFEVSEAEVRAMLVDDVVGPLQSPPAQLPGTNLSRSGPVVPLPTKGLVSQPADLAGALPRVALDA